MIIWAHAGGFSGGNKSDEGYLVEPLVKRGYVVLAINYRLLAPGGCTGSSLTPTCIAAATGAISVAGGLPSGQGADATDPPGYLFSGTADTTVPYQWSVDTANALDQAVVNDGPSPRPALTGPLRART